MTVFTMETIVAQLEARLADIRVGLTEAREALKAVEQEETQIVKALRLLAPESEALPKTKPKVKRDRGKRQVGDGALNAVLAALVGGPKTMPQIAEAAGLSTTSVRHALTMLREQQLVRLAGKAPIVGRGGRPALFALMEKGEKAA